MKPRKLYVTQNDFERLQELLEGGGAVLNRDRKDLSALAEELKQATIVTPDSLPANVVTMNTRLRLMDLDTRQPFEMTVVFPQDADVDTGKVSIISPVGTAVLAMPKATRSNGAYRPAQDDCRSRRSSINPRPQGTCIFNDRRRNNRPHT
jgi:regulator of nucleoside diphosphate kinase